ncbi:MAG: hypothetical protein OXF68_00685 [Gammaproteobacteria bacterium]|nr:hypothetical protein [Gammaproteobacteria bacterium]
MIGSAAAHSGCAFRLDRWLDIEQPGDVGGDVDLVARREALCPPERSGLRR